MKVKSLFYWVLLILQNYAIYSQSSISPYNNTACVTYENLRYYNYSELFDYYDSTYIFPENYCYGVLTYNITVDAFNDIINLNLQAFKKYRQFLNLYYMYNNNSAAALSMDSSCLPFFRHVACYSTFQACAYDGTTIKSNPICSYHCETLNIRCDSFYVIDGICDINSTESYCAGVSESNYISSSFSLLILVVIFTFVYN
jgi:hypothetical protein